MLKQRGTAELSYGIAPPAFRLPDHLVSEALYLWDPDGLGIEVYADRPRDSWRRNDRELVMTTDPLDISSLIATGGGHPWEGVPAGTTMGHVHLHVGSLETAEAFYHLALGFDKTVWSYPGALFLSAGGYHHHLGTNTWSPGPSPSADQARLLEWELIVPVGDDVAAVAHTLQAAGYTTEETSGGVTTADPWGPGRASERKEITGAVHVGAARSDWNSFITGDASPS